MPLKIINWVCLDCGRKHGKYEPADATWHIGTCSMCGRELAVTEPRDFVRPTLHSKTSFADFVQRRKDG